MKYTYFIPVMLVLLTACATSPEFNTDGVNTGIYPNNAIPDSKNPPSNRVIWGGVILSSHNLKDTTQLEVLAYPLNANQLPQTSQQTIGRFIIQQPGFLETSIYTAGRMISVLGKVQSHQTGKVGEADYQYPVVQSEQIYLWSKDAGRSNTTFHFGLGVQL